MATSTPWGKSQYSHKVAPGIIFYGTAGHGGWHLSPTKNLKIPEKWRAREGWYEEDCGWSPIVLTFPELFPDTPKEKAENMVPHWESWVKRTGIGV